MRSIHRIRPLDDSIEQEWVRDSDEIGGVFAIKLRDEFDWQWSVTISAAGLIRDDQLEARLARAVFEALVGTRGITDLHHEDREVWSVSGRPGGRALVAAVSGAVESLRPEIEAGIGEHSELPSH